MHDDAMFAFELLMATVHPSAILHAPDEKERHEQEMRFIEDMKEIAKLRL
jgi:uracil-DNA glycosylase